MMFKEKSISKLYAFALGGGVRADAGRLRRRRRNGCR